ncbi:DMT family transporter [Streptomyces sp. B5E4]|uniref:DMT family transporter n=1 Tax=Streptomyces sp. B5E4 TaxID=3153568 RepID=UPI00325CC9F7
MNGMNGLATALVLALASAAAYAGAAVLQERVAGAGRESDAGVWAALTRGSWWLSVGLNAAGAALHVLALRYGPLTLIQPLGALTLVLALPLQAAATGRAVGAVRWRGAALTLAGLAGVLLLVRGGGHIEVLTPAQVLGTVAATAAALAALGAAARRSGPRAAGIAYATAAGIAFGAGSVLTQTIAVRPAPDAFTVLTGLVVAALAPTGLMLSQAAYRGGLGAPLATVTLVNPAVSAAVGLTLLGERLSGGALGPAVALAATALATRGVVLLSRPDATPAPIPVAVPARTGIPARAAAAARSAAALPGPVAAPEPTGAPVPAAVPSARPCPAAKAAARTSGRRRHPAPSPAGTFGLAR